MNPGKNILKALLALVAIALVLAWQADVFKSKTAAGETQDRRPVAEVKAILSVSENKSTLRRHLTGRLVARDAVDILARTSGELLEITVEAGSPVSRGELVIRLDDEMLGAVRDEATAALAVAVAEVEGTSRVSQRVEAAAEARALPETEAINARRAHKSAIHRVEQARAALRAAEVRLGDTRLHSPMDGTVIDTYKSPGDWVPPGEPLLSLFDPKSLEIEVGVPEALATQLDPGLTVKCVIEPLGTDVTATIRTLVPRADPATRTVLAKLTLDAPEAALPGMFVRVELDGETQKTLEIPRSAVRNMRQLDFVSAVDSDGRVAPRWVRLGRTRGDVVAVLAGLTPGDRILRHHGVTTGPATKEEQAPPDP